MNESVLIIIASYIFTLAIFWLLRRSKIYAVGFGLFVFFLILAFGLPFLLGAKQTSNTERVDSLSNFTRTVGFPETKFYTINNFQLFGYVHGFGKNQKISIDQNIFENYPIDEIRGIAAHELGHAVHNDLILDPLVITGGLILNALLWLKLQQRIKSKKIWVLLTFVTTILSVVLVSAVLRSREYQADLFALQHLDDPKARARYFDRLGKDGLVSTYEESINTKTWMELFESHPLIHKRVDLVNQYSPEGRESRAR